ncbi:MAG: ATP phosphoribosyltransferase regulatory subunit [Pseudomonadales bacterium]
MNRNWRLPAGMDELLPPAAWSLELLRRQVLDVFQTWGYEYIEPPMVDYLDALLVGADADMDLQTLKVVDQRSGRLLGVRADLTAQAVRVDAHSLPVDGVQRLCYAGNVILANPLSPLESRVPVKAGAELFGAPTLNADAEVIALMLEVLSRVGVSDPILVVGHMGIYHALIARLALAPGPEAELFTAVQGKAETDIAALVEDPEARRMLCELPDLMGEGEVLERARVSLAAVPAALTAIDELSRLADLLKTQTPGLRLRFDLAELVGYGYHNGPVFSAYQADQGRALARGGRYDGIGAGFGRSRPATGFDIGLKELVINGQGSPAIWVPWSEGLTAEAATRRSAAVAALREAGEVVVMALSGDDAPPPRCDRSLVAQKADWVVENLRAMKS